MELGIKTMEDKSMKKFMRSIQTLAALLIAMAATMACTSDDNTIDGPTPETTAAPKTYTLTIEATKSSDDTATRALSLDGTGKLIATWKTTDVVTVGNVTPGRQADLGTLTPQSEGATTTLTGTLTGDIQVDDELSLIIDRGGDWTKPMDGTLAYISDHFDVAACKVHVASVDASNNITLTEGTADFANAIAVVRFHLADKAGNPLNASALAINIPSDDTWVPSDYTLSGMTDATYTANAYGSNTGAGVVYAAIVGCDSKTVTLTATVGAQTYTYSRAGVTFENGKFYDITVKMGKLMGKLVDLSTVAADYTLQNGDIMTGTLGSRVKISIADGATVTLRDATIPGDNSLYYQWAGLTCEGDATIRLEGANSVQGYYPDFPGILIPKGKTLTIDGSGSLTAVSGYGSGSIGMGAGIGGRQRTDCGQIVINGGTITATGGSGASGIGCGRSDFDVQASCDGITINGGTVTATGGTGAAGIGNGNMGNCGDITINGGTVTATKGSDAPYSIGMGRSGGTCGPVTIGGFAVANVVGSPYTYTGGDIARGTVTFSPRFSNWPDGTSMSNDEITHVGAASIVISDGTYAYPGVMTSAGAPSTVAAAPLSATVATGTGRTLTFTATGVTYEYSYMSQTGSFSGTFTGDITDGVSIGQVWMAKQ